MWSYVLPNKTKSDAREERLHLEVKAQTATGRLRELIAQLQPLLYRTEDSAYRHIMSTLAKSLARLGLFIDLETLGTEMREANKDQRNATYYIPRLHIEALVARRDYAEAFAKATRKIERGLVIYGAIYQGDLQDAYSMIEEAVAGRQDLNALAELRLVNAAARLAIVAHWAGNENLVKASLCLMRALLEEQAVSPRALNEDTDWMKSDASFGAYFLLTMVSAGQAKLAESLWFEHDFDALCSGVLATNNRLCFQLAMAGKTDRALDISRKYKSHREVFYESEDEYPTKLLRAICFRVARDGDLTTADRYAEDFLRTIEDIASPSDSEAWEDKVEGLNHVNSALSKLATFILWMWEAGATEITQQAVQAYFQLADRLPSLLDEKSVWHLVRRWDTHFVDFQGMLPQEELVEFASRQLQFLIENLDMTVPDERNLIAKWQLAFARIGQVPPKIEAVTFAQQVPIIRCLLDAGHREQAERVYQPLAELAAGEHSEGKDPKIHRWEVAQALVAVIELAPYFDQHDFGVDSIDQWKQVESSMAQWANAGSRIDYYRTISRSLVDATNVENATDWAESIPEEEIRLVALVEILHSATSEIADAANVRLTRIYEELTRIDPSGLVFRGGC